MRLYPVLLLAALLSGCVATGEKAETPDALGLIIAKQDAVSGCISLGVVKGSAPSSAYARRAAAEEAHKILATHLVYEEDVSENDVVTAKGRAYKCLKSGGPYKYLPM